MDLHGTFRAEFLTAEALDAFAPVYLRDTAILVGHHGYGVGRADVIALLAAYAFFFL